MGRRLLRWWEALPGRARVLLGIPLWAVALFGFHHAFPLLTWQDRLGYSLMEAIPLALLTAWATENELRRRREAGRPGPGEGDDVSE